MRKLAVLAILFSLTATAANADYYRNRNHNDGGHHHGGGGWFAPLVGGMVLGGVIYGLSQPSYAAQPAYRTECRIVPMIDRWNNYVGERRECYQIPNY